MTVNPEKLDTFMAVYVDELTKAVQGYPEEYRFPVDYVPTVVMKMRVAFAQNSFNKDGRAIKGTCKRLGIPYTYKGIASFLERSADNA